MNSFKTYHPVVNFTYFTFVIVFSCICMHPAAISVSLVCSFIYSIILNGKKSVKFNFLFMLPVLIAAALINPAFNHEGVTILAYLPNNNPLTLESIIYGVAAGAVMVSVICWFSCFNAVITSDKFIYLFGKIIPSLSLILSMTLRFVPKFKAQIKAVSDAQRGLGRDVSSGSIIQRAKNGLTILSIMLTWALENSVETADSMKSRGYGLADRTAFSIYKFSKRDAVYLTFIIFSALYVIIGYSLGGMYFRYFPYMKSSGYSLYSVSIFTVYFLLSVMPVIIEISEELKWKAIESNI